MVAGMVASGIVTYSMRCKLWATNYARFFSETKTAQNPDSVTDVVNETIHAELI